MKRILIVDDNEVVREILDQFLVPRYAVDHAGNAPQGVAAVLRQSPDVILLDVKMPGLDGLSLLRSLRTMGVQTPVLVMTGYDSPQVARAALEGGATGYLPKPFDLMHLDRLITEAAGTPTFDSTT